VVYSYRGHNYTEWTYGYTEFGTTAASDAILTSLQMTLTALVMVVMLALNVASIFAFQKYMNRKSKLRVRKSKYKKRTLILSLI
jgi:hypothetical protein